MCDCHNQCCGIETFVCTTSEYIIGTVVALCQESVHLLDSFILFYQEGTFEIKNLFYKSNLAKMQQKLKKAFKEIRSTAIMCSNNLKRDF